MLDLVHQVHQDIMCERGKHRDSKSLSPQLRRLHIVISMHFLLHHALSCSPLSIYRGGKRPTKSTYLLLPPLTSPLRPTESKIPMTAHSLLLPNPGKHTWQGEDRLRFGLSHRKGSPLIRLRSLSTTSSGWACHANGTTPFYCWIAIPNHSAATSGRIIAGCPASSPLRWEDCYGLNNLCD